VAPAATITVPGATAVDTDGLVPGAVAETPDGQGWVVVHDPRVTQPEGLIARVAAGATSFTSVTPLVTGCSVTAIAAQGTALWAATCNAALPGATTSGAGLVELDAQGTVVSRRSLPTSCVAQLAAGTDSLWVVTAPRSNAPPQLLRVDPATGTVSAPADLHGEQVLGLAVAGDDPWTGRASATGDRLVRTDATTGADAVSIPGSAARVVDVVAATLWTEQPATDSVASADATTGQPQTSVTVANLQAVQAATSGVWFEQASTGSLTITLGRIDPSGHPTTVASFTGAGPDRTGLPFLGTLSATARGAWLATQNRLFLLPAPS